MAYNNGFPVTYPQYYPPQQMQQPQMPQPQMQAQQSQMQNMQMPQSQTMQSNMIWVQGEAGAKSFLLAPNTTVQLWDSEAQVIYLKSADATGMPTMKILDYTVRGQGQTPPKIMEETAPQMDYVTHDELKDLEDRLIQRFNDTTVKAGKDHEHKPGSNNRNVTTNKV